MFCRFNPRARVGRDGLLGFFFFGVVFQSTRPRGARLVGSFAGGITVVSIHAPAWGATKYFQLFNAVMRFNPRARVGRDLLRRQQWHY